MEEDLLARLKELVFYLEGFDAEVCADVTCVTRC